MLSLLEAHIDGQVPTTVIDLQLGEGVTRSYSELVVVVEALVDEAGTRIMISLYR